VRQEKFDYDARERLVRGTISLKPCNLKLHTQYMGEYDLTDIDFIP
jgi:hypothetical protein